MPSSQVVTMIKYDMTELFFIFCPISQNWSCSSVIETEQKKSKSIIINTIETYGICPLLVYVLSLAVREFNFYMREAAHSTKGMWIT